MRVSSIGSAEDFPALSPSAAPSSSISNSLFSYASQAGQPLSNGPLPPGMPASALLSGQSQREFSQDDFPALGGYPSQQSQSQSTTTGDLPSLTSGVNGMSLTGRTAAVAAAGQGQEQASALAALAAQQQHRASLLGAMNGGSAQRQASSAGLGGIVAGGAGGGSSQSEKVRFFLDLASLWKFSLIPNFVELTTTLGSKSISRTFILPFIPSFKRNSRSRIRRFLSFTTSTFSRK